MIQVSTILKVVDKTGITSVKCVKVLGMLRIGLLVLVI